jgi:antirestriction protein ArdC
MSLNSSKPDLYEQVTQALISALEQGAGEYRMPWHSLSQPVNAISHKAYRGINTLLLWAAAQKNCYDSNEWATYRQWQEVGGQVRKGERSTLIVFWKFFDSSSETEETPEDGGETSNGKRARHMARAYHVFNASQVDGVTAKSHEDLPASERIAHAEQFFAALPGTVICEGERACYSPSDDSIHMPPFSKFKSGSAFYSVLADERAHWAGSAARLNRDLTGRFGDEKYAMEELISEISSAMLCAHLQLNLEPRLDHAPYVQNWLKVLRDDKRAVLQRPAKRRKRLPTSSSLRAFRCPAPPSGAA